MMKYKIYMHTFPDNKSYIGQTCQKISRRLTSHRVSKNSAIYDAIETYGIDNIKTEILYNCDSVDEANRLEILSISRFDTVRNGYNRNYGATNHVVSQETRDKQSKSHLGKVSHRRSIAYSYPSDIADMYRIQKMTAKDIADVFGVAPITIGDLLDKYKIPKRTMSETKKGHKPSKETRKKLSESGIIAWQKRKT